MARNVLDLERYVPALLVFISNKLSRGGSATYRRLFGIGVTEWRILAMLAVEPNIPANRICQVIGFDKALVSRVVQALAAQGLVSSAPNPGDGRRHTIALTLKGKRLHDRVIEVALERERLLLADLAPAEVETLIHLLRRLHRRVDAVNAYDPTAARGTKSVRQRRTNTVPQAAE